MMVDRVEEIMLADDYEWPRPEYSRKAIRRAGELLEGETLDTRQIEDGIREATELLEGQYTEEWVLATQARHERFDRWLDAYRILANWRASHFYPLTVMYVKLAVCCRRIDRSIFTANRLKRLPSIISKLRRFDHMSLARMQDLGGCRAVVSNLQMVHQVRDALVDLSGTSVLESSDDYIENPKDDGYRGIHLIFRFVSTLEKSVVYDGMRIEVQLRTKVQHAWATAVETVDLFQRQTIKAGGGDDRWRKFFRLVSEAFAAYEAVGLDTSKDFISRDLRDELTELVAELDVFERLEHYRNAIQLVLKENGPTTFLLKLDLDKKELNVVGYNNNEQEKAQADYAEAERLMGPNEDVVLVSVQSAMDLGDAYPNYFADTRLFLEGLRDTLGWVSHNPMPQWLLDQLPGASKEH